MIVRTEILMRLKRLMSAALFAVTFVATHAGTALASDGSGCLLTNAQATSILGSTASDWSPSPAKGCIYSSSSTRSTIDIDRYSRVHKLPSVRALEALFSPSPITPPHGIGVRAYLTKSTAPGLKVVTVCFEAGGSFYLVNLDAVSSVPGKEILRLEAAVTVATKKLQTPALIRRWARGLEGLARVTSAMPLWQLSPHPPSSPERCLEPFGEMPALRGMRSRGNPRVVPCQSHGKTLVN